MPNSKHVLKRYKQGRRQSFHLAPHQSNAQRSAKARMHRKFHEFAGLHMPMQRNDGCGRVHLYKSFTIQTEFGLLKPSCESFSLLVLYIDVVQLLQIQTQLMLYLSVTFSYFLFAIWICVSVNENRPLPRLPAWDGLPLENALNTCIFISLLEIKDPWWGSSLELDLTQLYTPQPDLSWINLRPPYT